MQLTVKDIVDLLKVSERTVYRWLKAGSIPSYKVNEQYRFNRVEILEWATAQRIHVSPAIFDEPSAGTLPNVSDAIRAGGIYYRVGGSTKQEVLNNIINLLNLPEDVDSEFLLQVLLARESLGSTAIGEGIAIPHPRNPIVMHIARPMIGLCFLETPINFGAVDGRPVQTIFMLITPTVRSHLHLLSRLAFSLKNHEWKKALSGPATREEILDILEKIEPKAEAREEKEQR